MKECSFRNRFLLLFVVDPTVCIQGTAGFVLLCVSSSVFIRVLALMKLKYKIHNKKIIANYKKNEYMNNPD